MAGKPRCDSGSKRGLDRRRGQSGARGDLRVQEPGLARQDWSYDAWHRSGKIPTGGIALDAIEDAKGDSVADKDVDDEGQVRRHRDADGCRPLREEVSGDGRRTPV